MRLGAKRFQKASMHSSGSGAAVLVVKEASIPQDAPREFDHELRHAASSPGNKVTTGMAALDSEINFSSSMSHVYTNLIGADLLLNGAVQLLDDQHWIKTIPLDDPELAYSHVLQVHMCYDAVPMSTKLVVFDLKLQVKKAFYGLIYNSTRTALLHDSVDDKLVGILSITDFIRVLLKLKKKRDRKLSENDGVLSEAEAQATNIGEYEIGAWRDMIAQEGKQQPFVHIMATDSLYRAAQVLTEHRIHRLPVMDPVNGNPLYILTHKRLLKFIWLFHQQLPRPPYMDRTARDLGVGCWTDIRVVHPDTPLVECLEALLDKGISGLPVVAREDHKVVDMYSRFDAIGIAAENRFDDLDITVEQALEHRNSFKTMERVVSVLETDTMLKTMSVLVESEVHRVCATDENGLLKGIVSLSDVIKFVVLRPVHEHEEQH
uniref:CBS domain-containing protein n=1 Tax=Plectus sambesii TaxID=2011161 RepID=A0A914VWD0_9BILA